MAKYEEQIAVLEEKIKTIEDRLASGETVDSSVYTEHANLQKELENVMSMWEIACEELETIRN